MKEITVYRSRYKNSNVEAKAVPILIDNLPVFINPYRECFLPLSPCFSLVCLSCYCVSFLRYLFVLGRCSGGVSKKGVFVDVFDVFAVSDALFDNTA